MKTPRGKERKEVHVNHNRYDGVKSCQKCSAEHGLYACEQFKALSSEEKSSFIKEKRLCFNSLRSGHGSKDCKSKTGAAFAKKVTIRCSIDPVTQRTMSQTLKPVWVTGETLGVVLHFYQRHWLMCKLQQIKSFHFVQFWAVAHSFPA